MFDKVLNTLLQFIVQAFDFYRLEALAICLLNLLNIFHLHHISTSIVHGPFFRKFGPKTSFGILMLPD